MLNRPLPSTPPVADDKSKRNKSKTSKSSEGRKSLISMLSHQKSDEGGRGSSPKGSSRTQVNGHNGSPGRPPSVQYQNSSPIHDRSDSDPQSLSSEEHNCDTMYAGPPTPFR